MEQSHTDEDAPTQMMGKTKSGYDIDFNNLSGKRRLELVEAGELTTEQFGIPANMPGVKLKEIRERNKQMIEAQLARKNKADESLEFKVGDFITYKEESYEILATDATKGYKIDKGDKKVWVQADSVTKG